MLPVLISALIGVAEGAEPLESVRVYGILKPTVVVAVAPAESYGRQNLSALTAAGNPALSTGRPEMSFQVAQTRFGLKIREKGRVRGTIELDFIDFEKSTPTTAALPRLRIATAEWWMNEHDRVILGQTWDLSAPKMPHHFDLVGGSFLSGNIGFMRQQVQLVHETDGVYAGAALGMPGFNNKDAAGNLELDLFPTAAGRIAWKKGGSDAGIGGIVGAVMVSPDERRLTWAVIVAMELALKNGLDVHGEAYVGQNTANTGMLTLSQGRPGVDVRDAGGWLSAKWTTPKVAPYLTIGAAGVLNPDDVVPAVAHDATGAAVRDPTAGPGIRLNASAHGGVEIPTTDGFAFVVQGFGFLTQHALDAADGPGDAVSYGVETGAIWRF